jgi:hypothetical protein
MGRREIFFTFSLLVEIEGHFTNGFVSQVYETEESCCRQRHQQFKIHKIIWLRLHRVKLCSSQGGNRLCVITGAGIRSGSMRILLAEAGDPPPPSNPTPIKNRKTHKYIRSLILGSLISLKNKQFSLHIGNF